MSQDFLLSSRAKSLSLAAVFRMSDAEAEDTFRKVRWPETHGEPACPICGVDAYPTKHGAQKGETAGFVLLMLKEADGPLTSLAITEAQIKTRGLNAGDETVVLMRKRVGACLTTQQRLGVVRSMPVSGPYKGWELVR